MTTYAADSYGDIFTRSIEIRAKEQPKCPMNDYMSLYICLRSSMKCQDICPLRDRWMGLEGKPKP